MSVKLVNELSSMKIGALIIFRMQLVTKVLDLKLNVLCFTWNDREYILVKFIDLSYGSSPMLECNFYNDIITIMIIEDIVI